MKVYLFDAASGLYEGADIIDPVAECEDKGIMSITPPVNRLGQVAVHVRAIGNLKLDPTDSTRRAEKRND